jgi:hypothetical protein
MKHPPCYLDWTFWRIGYGHLNMPVYGWRKFWRFYWKKTP